MSHTNIPRITKFAHISRARKALSNPSYQEAFDEIKSCQHWKSVEALRSYTVTAKTYQALIYKDTEGIRTDDYQARYKHAATEARRIKYDLPIIVWSGQCTTRKEGLFKHSGILCLDLDGKDNLSLNPHTMAEAINHLTYVLGWFVSPSGDGLKVLIRIQADESSHLHSFLVAEKAFAKLGVTVDPSGKDLRRLCFVSSDQRAVLRPWGSVQELDIPCFTEDKTCYTDNTDEYKKREGKGRSSITTKPALPQVEREANADAARKNLEASPALKRLYVEYIEKRFIPEQGKRNSQLVAMVTFLFHAVGVHRLFEMVMLFHELNQDIFEDSREQHQGEAISHLLAVKRRWNAELNVAEKTAISNMNSKQIEIFRICRDLQVHQSEKYPQGVFFLGFCELGDRVNKKGPEAQRIMQRFEKRGILKISKKGDSFRKGVRGGKATEYKWLLPYTPPPSKAKTTTKQDSPTPAVVRYVLNKKKSNLALLS